MSEPKKRIPEDRFTNTVEGAAGYERWRSESEWYNEEPDHVFDEDYDAYDPDDDVCGCRDPGCPCSGPKRGGSP
jgi:hypothetical protein